MAGKSDFKSDTCSTENRCCQRDLVGHCGDKPSCAMAMGTPDAVLALSSDHLVKNAGRPTVRDIGLIKGDGHGTTLCICWLLFRL